MSKVDFGKLKQLREETGISFALCKKALEETGNDLGKAKKKLSDWGAEKVREKGARSTSQGALFSYIHHNKKIGALIELQCETDFVSSNKDFQKFGQEVAMQVASVEAKDVKELLGQTYIRDAKKTISDLLNEIVLKIGENIKIARFSRWEVGQ